ncbi:uncharacterized protein KZ484_011581 [Pholidichthys leucotaenia]
MDQIYGNRPASNGCKLGGDPSAPITLTTDDYASTPTEHTSIDTSTPASPGTDPSATDQDHPAPEPSPARSQFGTALSTLSRTGKRKRSNTKQDLYNILASMQEAEREQHREQMELQRKQLELNSLLVDEVRQSREAEVASQIRLFLTTLP